MFNFKKENLIQQKENELLELKQNSSRAVDIVTSTINQLLSVNKNIDVKLNEIEEMKNQLSVTESGLSETRLKNTKIISKFQSFLED